ncbi:MAG: hypothetical protein ACE5H9_06095 [Anaerolineae bacterium]
MRKLIVVSIIALITVLAFAGGRLYYFGFGDGYVSPVRELPVTKVEDYAKASRLDAADTPSPAQGVVAIDFSHRNALFLEELNTLLARIVARGYSYELALNDVEGEELTTKLQYANALILPLPRADYTAEEITAIERFVEKGGRVFLIGDPTRTVDVEALNSVAGSFGIIFANDYLYALDPDRKDNNYRNVVFKDFKESPLTRGLAESGSVIFYGGGSVNAPNHEIILGDGNIFSSISEGGRTLAAAVLTTNNQVLALGDLTFFSEPYSAAEANGIFINNIADFITGGKRDFNLEDFPFFFNPSIDIVFDNTLVFNSQFENAVLLKEFLEEDGHSVTFADGIDGTNDVIFIGRYEDAKIVQNYLDAARITILDPDEETEVEEVAAEDETEANKAAVALVSDAPDEDEERFIDGRIRMEGIGDLERGGSTLFHLNQDDNRNVLIILSDNPDTNKDAFELLLEHKLPECLVSASTAVCQTERPEERLPPSLRSNRIDKILIVSDDDGRARKGAQTGALAYSDALSATYKVDIWSTSDDGSPDLDKLQSSDAVIWSTGNYWDDSIGEEDTLLLTEYVLAGGNLVLSGASIAFDWDHTQFLTDIAHADYLDFGEQQDLELVLPDHPIAEDFTEGAVITFTETTTASNTVEPDVVRHTKDARVVFQRGAQSEHEGAAAIIAYEDKRTKIAYFAFPIYLLPAQEGALLINNTVDWFTEKILEPPQSSDYEPYSPPGPAAGDGDEDAEGEEGGETDDSGENGGNGSNDNGDGGSNGGG